MSSIMSTAASSGGSGGDDDEYTPGELAAGLVVGIVGALFVGAGVTYLVLRRSNPARFRQYSSSSEKPITNEAESPQAGTLAENGADQNKV